MSINQVSVQSISNSIFHSRLAVCKFWGYSDETQLKNAFYYYCLFDVKGVQVFVGVSIGEEVIIKIQNNGKGVSSTHKKLILKAIQQKWELLKKCLHRSMYYVQLNSNQTQYFNLYYKVLNFPGYHDMQYLGDNYVYMYYHQGF